MIDGRVRIPAGVSTDLEAFRAWARSDERPQRGRFSYLNGLLWVDLGTEQGMEQLYTHNDVKTATAEVLRPLGLSAGLGRYFGGGALLSHPTAGLSTVPDGLFVLYASFHEGRVREVPNARNVGAVELEGSADMVLEVVSDSSVEKDNTLLPGLYWQAGVSEFWRVDARGPQAHFEILARTDTGYAPTQEADGWWRSAVFGRSFRLTQAADPRGRPVFTLEVRA